MPRLLGLSPHTPQRTDIRLTDVYATQTTLPSSFGATGLDWKMFGNDQFGDCYWASAAHEVMAQAHLAGRIPPFDTEHVLTSYARYLGLGSAADLNERTDEGTDARQGAKFRKTWGVLDQNDHGHRIGAYAFIEPGRGAYETIISAVHDFEAVTVCVELPQSAKEAFDQAEAQGAPEIVWDAVKGSKIAGGHAVAGTSVRDDQLVVVSWGREVVVSKDFIDSYLQTVVVYVSGSTLNSEGKTVTGLDIDALREKLRDLYS